MEKKHLIGRKARGFRFNDDPDNGVVYYPEMYQFEGSIGVIRQVDAKIVGVQYNNATSFFYPLSEIEQHLVEDTPSQYEVGMTVYDWEFGKGVIQEIDFGSDGSEDFPICVMFEGLDELELYTNKGKYNRRDKHPRLSLTPYDLVNGGATFPTFKPELPEIEKGTLVYVKTGFKWEMRFFSHFDDSGNIYCFINQEKSGKAESWHEYSITNPLIDEKER